MKHWQRILPVLLLFFGILGLAKSVWEKPYAGQAYDFAAFSQIPVLHNGRHQPLDSFARNSLMILTDKQYYLDAQGQKQPAIRWVLEVMSGSPEARKHKVFRIEHDEVLSLMGLAPREGLRYALDELIPKYQALVQQATAAFQKPDNQRDLVDVKVIELYNQIELYRQIMSFEVPLVLPPAQGPKELWLPLGAEKNDLNLTSAANVWYKSLKAFRNNDPVLFQVIATEHLTALRTSQPQLFPRLPLEQRFNHVQPFYQAMVLLVCAFLLSVFGWLFWGPTLNKSAFYLLVLGLVVFTVGMFVRMYLQGRPPVTNLYSSAIFVGWIAVLMGIGIEWFLKNGFGTIMASITGFCSLLVAHNLSGGGDTMEMMRAVLDTNFWLATHVTTVTMGYSASFLAGFMAMVLVIMGVFTRQLTPDLYHKISGMIYGTVAFATLFSFVGTVLGGIWADQSWGRFWGWDPKENGAAMIVLWNVIILHARWGGIARRRGIALLAIGGNIITAWSWFGVNMLGVGLHSYGFTDKAFVSLASFVLLNLVLISIGSIPEEHWRSLKEQTETSDLQGDKA